MDTLIQHLAMENEAGNEFYIKRDDLLPFSIGGNKVRIAEAFYEDMKAKHCDTMIIYGSRHSNLCRVLSDLCFSRGTKCVMICSHESGEEDAPTNNTHLIGWTGAQIVNCAKDEIAQTVEHVMNEIRACGGVPYYIYGDKYGKGNEGTAARAYAKAYREFLRQEQELGVNFDYIFCPSGTGSTQTGLICGHLLAGDHKCIMGVMISSRETERAYQVIEEGIRAYFEEHPSEKHALPADRAGEIHLLDAYRQEGYGKYDERVEACIRQQYLENGIPLDPIYTAKAFWGMTEYVRTAGIQNSRILFLHTGGTPLFFDYVTNSSEQQKKS